MKNLRTSGIQGLDRATPLVGVTASDANRPSSTIQRVGTDAPGSNHRSNATTVAAAVEMHSRHILEGRQRDPGLPPDAGDRLTHPLLRHAALGGECRSLIAGGEPA